MRIELDDAAPARVKWLQVAPDAGPPLRLARADSGALHIELAGVEAVLRPSGAVHIPCQGLLVAADLHLEKGSSYAERGQLLPPYDTAATLLRLEAEIKGLDPRRVLLLGDSFHDARALSRLAEADLDKIRALARGRDFVWAAGNHDEGLEGGLSALPGRVEDDPEAAGLTFRHEPLPHPQTGEVSGHLHPCAKVVSQGRAVRRRTFLTDGARLILPAFGSYAGGLNACDAAFQGLFVRPPLAALLGVGAVHPIAFSSLCPDGGARP